MGLAATYFLSRWLLDPPSPSNPKLCIALQQVPSEIDDLSRSLEESEANPFEEIQTFCGNAEQRTEKLFPPEPDPNSLLSDTKMTSTPLRCTACDQSIIVKSETKTNEGQSGHSLPTDKLAALCRQLLKPKSVEIEDFLETEGQVPFCETCQDTVSDIQAFQDEIERLTVLINEALAEMRSKLQNALHDTDDDDEDASLLRARQFLLGIERGPVRGRNGRFTRRSKSSPKKSLATKSLPAPPPQSPVNENVVEIDPDSVIDLKCSDVSEGPEMSEGPYMSEGHEDLSSHPDTPTMISTTISLRSRNKRKNAVKDYSKLSRGDISSEEEVITGDIDMDNEWIPEELDEEDVKPKKRPRKLAETLVDKSEEIPEKKKNKGDSRPRKTARRKLNIVEAEPGIFEWKGVKFRWLEGGKIECGGCKKILKSKLCLIIHIRKIHLREGVGEFPCSFCGKKFQRLESLKVHEDIHSGPRHQCNYCGKLFHQQANLTHHLKSHVNELTFECEYPDCGKKFLTSRQLRVHCKRHEGVKSFQCEFCSRMFIFRAELTAHLRSHAEELPFQCHLCDSKFFIKFRLRRHWKNVHKLDPSLVPEEFLEPITSLASQDRKVSESELLQQEYDDNDKSATGSKNVTKSDEKFSPQVSIEPVVVTDVGLTDPDGIFPTATVVDDSVTIMLKLL